MRVCPKCGEKIDDQSDACPKCGGQNQRKATSNPSPSPLRSWILSLLIGILATIGLASLTPVWMLAQMGGPVAFGVLWSLVTLPMLLLVILINRRNGWFSGMISGVTFALPVVLFCFGLPTTDPFIKEHYEREIYLFMVLTPVLTVGLLVWCSMVRALLCDKATGPSK